MIDDLDRNSAKSKTSGKAIVSTSIEIITRIIATATQKDSRIDCLRVK